MIRVAHGEPFGGATKAVAPLCVGEALFRWWDGAFRWDMGQDSGRLEDWRAGFIENFRRSLLGRQEGWDPVSRSLRF